MRRVLAAVFFASGMSALLFETAWFRLAGLTFGNSVWASSMVLASFMGGLALGNALAARASRARLHPLRMYALLEAAIAISGVALVFAFPLLSERFAPLFAPLIDRVSLLNALRLTLAGALMLVPTTAMGATLPLLVRALSRDDDQFGSRLGLLYGWNTAGAVAGSLAGELVLIEAFGLRGTALVAGALNVVAAVVAMRAAQWSAGFSRPLSTPAKAGPPPKLLLAAMLSGATLLALEVVWFRFLLLFIDGTTIAFALMLAVVLLGIAAGGLIASRVFVADADAQRWTSMVALASGIATVVCFAGFSAGAPSSMTALDLMMHDAGAALRLMLLTSIGSGLLFTFIGRAVQKALADDAAAAAYVTLANTVGAMLGALAGGFLLLPHLGIEKSLFALACAYGVVALLTMERASRALIAAAIAFVLALAFFPFGVTRNTFVPQVTERYRTNGERIIGLHEGLTETAIYLRRDLFGQPYSYRLMTNVISMSGTSLPSLRYMSLFVDLPMALNPTASRALLISYGVGTTAKALTDTKQLKSIDVVDISRDIVAMNRLREFRGGHPLDDPRVRVHIEDGRFFLQTTRLQFDLITAEPPPPKHAGIVNLYSLEYFQLIQRRLAPGGIATYWLPIYQLSESDGKAIIKAFCGAFADCSLWSGAGGELILMGTRDVRRVPAAQFASRWSDPVTGRVLNAIGVDAPEMLGALFIGDTQWLAQLTAGAQPLVDNWPLRLSPKPVAGLPRAFETFFDVPASRQRFAASRWIASVWPPDFRQKTLAAFPFHEKVDRYFLDVTASRTATNYAAVEYVLTRSNSTALPVILMGSDQRQQDIVASLREKPPGALWVEGVRALSERRYADAVKLFESASRALPSHQPWARDAAFARRMGSGLH
jgi:predicted membrane-bound spermidine synthase